MSHAHALTFAALTLLLAGCATTPPPAAFENCRTALASFEQMNEWFGDGWTVQSQSGMESASVGMRIQFEIYGPVASGTVDMQVEHSTATGEYRPHHAYVTRKGADAAETWYYYDGKWWNDAEKAAE